MDYLRTVNQESPDKNMQKPNSDSKIVNNCPDTCPQIRPFSVRNVEQKWSYFIIGPPFGKVQDEPRGLESSLPPLQAQCQIPQDDFILCVLFFPSNKLRGALVTLEKTNGKRRL